MIDRDRRNELIHGIERFLAAEINNADLEQVLFPLRSPDVACFEIARAMLLFSSDFRLHKNEGPAALTEHHTRMIRRWVHFLQSDVEWPIRTDHPRKRSLISRLRALVGRWRAEAAPAFLENEYWPYEREAGWRQLKPNFR